MAPERRQQILLGGLAVVLALVAYRMWTDTSTPAAPASNRAGAAASGPARPGTSPAEPTAPDVHLKALADEKPKPGANDRNLFRFQPKAPPSPPPSARITKPEPVAPSLPAGPPPPPPLPPIQLKFIGVVIRGGGDSGTPTVRVAVLSDPAGHVMHGVEGGTIDGRFRIVRIGEQSIELSYLDGRGRQTIRKSGS